MKKWSTGRTEDVLPWNLNYPSYQTPVSDKTGMESWLRNDNEYCTKTLEIGQGQQKLGESPVRQT